MKSYLVAILLTVSNFGFARPPIDLNDVRVEDVNEQIEETQKACKVKKINLDKLDFSIHLTLAKVQTEADLTAEFRFLFKVSDPADFASVEKLGITVVTEIGTIGTARGNLCQILKLSNLRGLISVQGATKLTPQPGSTGSN